MAKIRNGLFSIGASGTIGHLITYHQHNTAPIARRAPRTSEPASAAQGQCRTRCREAAASWRGLIASKKLEWASIAALSGANPFAKYLLEWITQRSTPATPPLIPMR